MRIVPIGRGGVATARPRPELRPARQGQQASVTVQLIYVADPMCSWCYGFAPQLAAIVAARPDLPWRLLLGGLRPFTREPIEPGKRAEILGHWQRVAQLTGQPFGADAMARPGFVYDTEPACRAVVTARHLDAAHAAPLFAAVQTAFYRDGRDVTQADELADLAQQAGLDRAVFVTAFDSQAMHEATRDDFAQVQRWGVSGFPTLVADRGGALQLLAAGYSSADTIIGRIATLEAKPARE